MANVKSGGLTANKGTRKAQPGGSAAQIRARFDGEGKATQKGVVFVGNVGHLWLRPPGTKDKRDPDGRVYEKDPGLFVDFGGVGITREFDPDLEPDAVFINEMRATLERHPRDRNVVKYKIRELKPEEAAPPFEQFDEWNADAIKVAMLSRLGKDHDDNVRQVREAQKYEIAKGEDSRDEVLQVLEGLVATEAAVSNAFDVEVTLSEA